MPDFLKSAPDPGWLDVMKLLFGFLLLVLLAVLAAFIALGKVEQNTSFGLQDILGGLLVLAGGFAHWCFGSSKSKAEPKD
jgi:thiol:disulfide interchange protein